MSDIRQVEDGKVMVYERIEPTEPSTDTISPVSIEERAVGQMLGFENDLDINMDDVNIVLKWAKTQTDNHDPMNLKWVIRDLKTKLATPPLGESWRPSLVRYAQLALESRKIQEEQISLVK